MNYDCYTGGFQMTSNEKKVDRRAQRTKRLFKRAFIDLLYEKDYNDISVTDIVEKADFNRSTFYFHYKYKEELVSELNDSMINGLISAFSHNSLLINLSPSNIIIFDYILRKKEFFILWKYSEAIPNMQQLFIHKFTEAFKKELSRSKTIRSDNEIDIDMLIVFNINGLLGMILYWINRDFEESSKYMALQLFNFLKNPLFTDLISK